MTAALGKLAFYFGAVGIVSIVAWVVAALLMAAFVCGVRRSAVCWLALAAAILGLGLAEFNSNRVSAIEIDFSEQLRAARQRAAEETEMTPGESDVSDEAEKARQAEVTEKEELAERPGAAETETPKGKETSESKEPAKPEDADDGSIDGESSGDESRYSYRQRGPVERTEGMKVAEKIPIGPGTEDQPVAKTGRTLKPREWAQANTFDRVNLFFARWTCWLAIFLVAVDYFRRFNLTFKSLLPVPLGGRLVDSLFPKTHTVLLHGPSEGMVRKYLQRAVRKGETFIYFGPEDPWAIPSLERLLFVWSLKKITCTPEDEDFDDEFLFESAWFGRYCFVAAGDGHWALAKVAGLADFLELRRATRASAPHTVNVVWELESAIPPDTLTRLANLCRETNFKLLVATAGPFSEESAACFEERWSGAHAPEKA